jgi:RNA polymerase sigma-70 factor, ECF subfamily
MTIKEKLDLAKNGDADAFVEVFSEYKSVVSAIAYRIVGVDDVEDIVMETYLAAWKALPNFRGCSSINTWLFRIACNCSLQCLKRQRRCVEWSESNRTIGDSAFYCDHDANDPSIRANTVDKLVNTESIELMRLALHELNDIYRIPLMLRYADGLAYKEIAAATGVNLGTVMSRLYYGKKRMRKIIDSLEQSGAVGHPIQHLAKACESSLRNSVQK